jgi:flagellin-specific chaperone FliS
MPKKSSYDEFLCAAFGSSGKLHTLILLIDRAIILLKEAQAAPGKRAENLVKAQNILAQLERALDFKRGKLSGNLFFIYDFIFDELSRRDSRGIRTALRLLGQLRDTYTELRKRR